MRALIVDDSRAMRNAIRDILNRAQIQSFEAEGAREALEALWTFQPVDLAIVDWNLRAKAALMFTREVRRRPEFASLWLIMVTAAPDLDVVLEALRAGVDDWLVKPFSKQELLLKVARFRILPDREEER